MKEWTIMVYMAGDNDLSADMVYALEDMTVAMAGNTNANLLVYYDGLSPTAPTMYCDFTDSRDPHIVESSSVEKTYFLKKYGEPRIIVEENSAAVYSILNFVDWCVNKVEYDDGAGPAYGRRAEKYAFVFSGHSSAFQARSLLIDSSSDYYLTIPKLRWALRTMTRSGTCLEEGQTLLIGQPIDLLGFDSCVMGMLELAGEFSRYAKTMVASEGSIPSAGWTYGNILGSVMSGNNTQDERYVAKKFVESFIRKQAKYTIGGVDVDMAAWDLTKVKDVVEQADDLGACLLECLRKPVVGEQLKRALLACQWKCQSYMSVQNVDLVDFAQLLIDAVLTIDPTEDLDIVRHCKAVIRAVHNCIIQCGFTGGTYQYSNGISIFFPWTASTYYSALRDYSRLGAFDGEKLSNWNSFLKYYLTEVTLRASRTQSMRQSSNGNYAYFAVKENVAAGTKENVAAGTKENVAAGTKENVAAGTKENVAAGTKENVAAGTKENVAAGTKENVAAGTKENVAAGTKENVAAGTKGEPGGAFRDTPGMTSRENPAAGTKGMMTSILANLKNVYSPYDISGFSKEPEIERTSGNGTSSKY